MRSDTHKHSSVHHSRQADDAIHPCPVRDGGLGPRVVHHGTSRVLILFLAVSALWVMTGCSGRKVTTTVQDQTRSRPSKPAAIAPSPVPEEKPAETPASALLPSEVRSGEPDVATGSPSVEGKEEAETVVSPAPAEAPSVELEEVFFDFDRFTIRGDAKPVLEANAERLRAQGDGEVVIEGHCDQRGSADYNLLLGERRALAVKRYLQGLGIQGSRMHVVTYGKERPVCTQHNDACWQKNRRARLVLKQP